MDAQVPAVVAVVVTSDPAPWLEEALASLAAQDYEELSILVLSTAEADSEVGERVARVLPDAFVRHLPGRPGYAGASNEALGMVEGAAFFLLCHDDVALFPDAVHKLVEESFRSNAGVVSPKFLNWDDPRILLHVGMSCDKTGAVVDRITEGEVDHGQHDAVRDVFVAPGGCILVRADLFAELKGFDPGIVAMGEDLDLSWRSQVAGSRVVVAPEARVRHREALASGLEPLAVPGEPEGRHPLTLQSLQRRHELRVVLKCYTRIHLLRVLPQAALLAFGEVVVAVLARDGDRVRAVTGAWRWNARRLTELSVLRREVAEHRLFPDSEVRRLQVRGSARLSRYLSRLSHQGLEAANAVAATRESSERETERTGQVAVLTGSVGSAFSEDADFDELDDLGRRAGRDRFGRRVRSAPLSTGRQRAVALVIALIVIAIGTRDLFFGTLPLVGQLAPLPSWSTSWHHFFSGWQSAGVGTTAPASPAFGLVGITGTVLFGAMGTLQRVLLLGCIPVGAWGVWRYTRPLLSARARVIAVICYLGLPLPYGALGTGRWDGLVAFAAFPFIALRLARAANVAPYAVEPGPHWRSRPVGQVVILGAVIAVAAGFAPAVVPMVLVTAVAWVLGSALMDAREPTWRVLVVALQAVGVALALALPWVVGTVLAGRGSVAIFGLPVSGATAPNWGEVIRFAVGPAVRSPLAWLLVGAATLPLFIARGTRLAWAARLWVTALGSWGLAFIASHGHLGSFTPSETVVLAPAALAVAACVGIGIAAFENDLSGREFGWRQLVSVVALVFVALGLLPVVAGAVGGRWDLPAQGVEQPLSFLARPGTGVAPRPVARRPPRPAGGRMVGAVGPGLRAHAGGPARRGAGVHARRSGTGRPGRQRRAAGRGRRHRAPRSPVGARRRALRGRRGRAGPVHGRHDDRVGERATAAGAQRGPARPGRPRGGAGSERRAGLRERCEHAGHGHACRGAARARVALSGCGGRDGLAAGAQRALGRRAGDRTGAGGHPLRGLRAGGELRLDGRRSPGGAAGGLRLGGAVRGRREGSGDTGAVAVPLHPVGGAARAGGMGGVGGSRHRPPAGEGGVRRAHHPTARGRHRGCRQRDGGVMTPAHLSRERRWRVLGLVVLVVAGVAVAEGVRGTPAPATAAPSPSAMVGAPDAESSAWYCTGQSTAGGVSPGFLILTNTATRPVAATITAVTDTGATAHAAVAVPPRGVATPAIPALSSGSWEAETVITAGGGVAVTQTVSDSLGWSQAPCRSTTSAHWYFATGSTAGSDALYISLLNPTSTPVVVDLSFITPAGMVHPINYQGIVLSAGQVAVEDVASEVQEIPVISTVVSTRTGRVVASAVQQLVGPGGTSGGLSLVAGAAAPQAHWTIPQAQEVPEGSSGVDVFNPGTSTETVTVHFRLPSGPLAPLTQKVLPGTTWKLASSAQTRIPDNETYATSIDATGGSGVVVGRAVTLPASSSAPRAGMAVAVDGLSTRSPTGEWLVPPPGTSSTPAVATAAPASLALLNTSGGAEDYTASAAAASGTHVVATGTLAAGAMVVVSGSTLAAAGLAPIVVRASGAMAVSEDAGPSGGIGVVSMPGIPLAASIGV